MLANLLTLVIDFKEIILLSIVVGLAVILIGYLLCHNFKWQRRRLTFLGIFEKMSQKEAIWMSANTLRIIFCFSIIAFRLNLKQLYYVIFFVALTALANVILFNVKRTLMDLLNSAFILVALFVEVLLSEFLRDTNNTEWTIGVIYILLGIFIMLYITNSFLKDLCIILEEKAAK